jgi:hypothetical protein
MRLAALLAALAVATVQLGMIALFLPALGSGEALARNIAFALIGIMAAPLILLTAPALIVLARRGDPRVAAGLAALSAVASAALWYLG